MQAGYQSIIHSLDFLKELILRRLNAYFNKENADEFSYQQLRLDEDNSTFNNFLLHHKPSLEEYTIILLALSPHIQPNFLDSIVEQSIDSGGDFPEIGGVRSGNNRGMLPTAETAVFILAGNDLERRLKVQQIFSKEHFFYTENILWLQEVKEGEPKMSGRIILSNEYLEEWITGKSSRQNFSNDFPAKNIETKMTWDDLVLNSYTLSQVDDIQNWMKHGATLLLDEVLGKKLKPGYRALFYGPSGTGKTLTATLLGKQFQKDVYRIDLSQIVSKYIGETEKNLEKVFSKAENKDWILFFDEADALFGKRTNVKDSHDRYANQEVSYLLQRVEDYPGLIILASNFKSNMDDAFIRRFHTMIHFPLPNAAERLRLWEKSLPAMFKIEPSIDLKKLSDKYELTGASILNVIYHATLKALSKDDEVLRKEDLMEEIRKEYRKEERSIP
ncbi:MAG: ATP-binding protein [Ginsengibacter sp.]